ncbi:MAG TPA: radical SAM protein [Candidatus Blautia stercoripullorum]|uniref:Radical SAM protein n=1 Tax=Candidatus Blautia stercoripullorum TaxID=2838502 RepID=A0A9D2R7H6_9FIRM|nr:radical SAM protein [Candidatus Blautia stercoripullorum]
MSLPEPQKITPRQVVVQLGRQCNLSCSCCYLGESQDVVMSEEVMDAFLDNIHYVEELMLFGGEPSLYVEQAELFLKKLKERKMPLNYVSVNTNGAVRSEKFAKVVNDYIDYSTFSSESVFIISWDRWHEQSLMKKFPGTDIEANLEWYKKRLHTKYVAIEDEPDVELISEGRAKELLKDTKNHMINVGILNQGKLNFAALKSFREVCAGPDNLCGHGCVHNCVSCNLFLSAKGDVLLGRNVSYDRQDQGYYKICNVLEQSIFDGLLDLKILEFDYKTTIVPSRRLDIKSDIAKEASNLLEPDDFIAQITDELFAASNLSYVGDFEKAERLLEDAKDRFYYYLLEIQERLGPEGWKEFQNSEENHKLLGCFGGYKATLEDFNKLKTSGKKRFLEHFESEGSIPDLESEEARRELVWQFCTLKEYKNPET